MKHNEIKKFVYITVGLTTFFWLIIAQLISGVPFFSYESLRALNVSTAIVAVIWAGYFSQAWKWPYVRKLIFYRPNLNGTWIGEFKSDWKDAQGQGVPPGRFVLVVRQSFFSISIRAYSEKQKTVSYVESLVLDDGRGTKLLAYLYDEKRSAAVEHSPRQGAAELDLIETGSYQILEGEFWTLTRTTGFVRVKQAAPDLHVESFDQAVDLWRDQERWASVQC